MNQLHTHLHATGGKADHKTMKKTQKRQKKEMTLSQRAITNKLSTHGEAMNNDMPHLHFVRPTLLKVVKAHISLGEYNESVEKANKHVTGKKVSKACTL